MQRMGRTGEQSIRNINIAEQLIAPGNPSRLSVASAQEGF